MADVVPLRPAEEPDELMLLCPECDGGSFVVAFVDGQSMFDCTVCGHRMLDDVTAIACKPPVVVETPDSVTLRDHADVGPDGLFVMRRMLDKVNYDHTVAFVIFNGDGSVHTWGRMPDNDEEREWFETRLEGLRKTFRLDIDAEGVG